jgi:tRNA/rRNA methyltransferase
LKVVVRHGQEGPEPVLEQRPDLKVGEIVHACHQSSLRDGLKSLDLTAVPDDELDEVMTYCAERRCTEAHATCPGCRRRTEEQGLETLDEFARQHSDITIGDGSVRITGQGTPTAKFESFDKLNLSWAGESYWYWARRNLRKLRHGVRRAHIQGEAFAAVGEAPSVILMAPQLADNIGMVARAMGNFGLDDLRLVAPRDGWPNERARFAASGANYIIDSAQAYDARAEAVADFNWIGATTARQRDLRKPIMTPAEAAAEMRSRIDSGQRCALMFGGESSGLDNDDIADADAMIMIPVNSRFASLNLAQATLLIGYEWLKTGEDATLGRVTTYEKPVEPGLYLGQDQPADKQAVLGFFEHLERELENAGFFGSSHKRPTVVRNLRTMFTRMGPTDQEVRALRGIVATLVGSKRSGRN